jgi:hypothetical protein
VDFEQVLKEVVWRLVTEGSASYRRMKRSFGLDDDALEDVRRVLIRRVLWGRATRKADAEAQCATPLKPD